MLRRRSGSPRARCRGSRCCTTVIEPGELYLRVILGQDGATRDAWMEEHFDRLEDLRAQGRLDTSNKGGATPRKVMIRRQNGDCTRPGPIKRSGNVADDAPCACATAAEP
jgi:hypothetical protein